MSQRRDREGAAGNFRAYFPVPLTVQSALSADRLLNVADGMASRRSVSAFRLSDLLRL